MGRKRKIAPTPEQRIIRNALAANLEMLIGYRYGYEGSPTRRYEELGRHLGTSLSQVQRLIAGTVGTSIDELAKIAAHFHVTPWDLIDPSFPTRFLEKEIEPRARSALQRRPPGYLPPPPPRGARTRG